MTSYAPDPRLVSVPGRVPAYLGRVLSRDGAAVGTCFQIAPRVLVTAAHVVASAWSAGLGVQGLVDGLDPQHAPRAARVERIDPDHDLAVLTTDDPFPASVPGRARSDAVASGTRVQVVGVPQLVDPEPYRYASALGVWSGPALRGDRIPLQTVDAKAVVRGMSGAPVCRADDGVVVGVISGHYLSPDGSFRDAVWLARIEDLEPLLEGLAVRPADDGLGRLRAYLRAAVAAAQSHPNLGNRQIATPSLSTVYLRRGVSADEDEDETALEDWAGDSWHAGSGALRPQPAERVVGGGQLRSGHCVITAGPGMGKSSLLRLGLAAAARPWLGGVDRGASEAGGAADGEVPVLIEAAWLAGPGSPEQLIAAAVRDELRDASWDADFFSRPPAPGARWLVLVDGLDEVLEAERRAEVLLNVAALTRPDRGAAYRIVVTTRPLRGRELADLLARTGWAAERYILLPFDDDSVKELACRWFTALGLADPEQATDWFAAALERRRLQELARTPLMAAMLCQLYADAPDQDLPGSRGEIYRLYYQRLINRLYAPAPSGAFTQEALARFGPDAAAGALQAVQGLSAALGRLAVQRRAGDRAATMEIVLADPAMRRPGALTPEQWREFVASVLRRSGLLDFRRGDFVFLHQTLQDFLAARAAPERARTLVAMLAASPPPQRRRGAAERARGSNWRPPADDPSYLGFLLDPGAHDDPHDRQLDLEAALLRLAEHGGLEGCQFLTAQIALHTALPDTVKQRTAQELAGLAERATRDSGQQRALRTLAVIDREQALTLAVAKAPRVLDYSTTFGIILLIASLDRQQAVAILTPLVTATRPRGYEGCIRGAEILAGLDPSVGIPVLRTLATRVSAQERKATREAAYRAGGGEKLKEVLRAEREAPRDADRVAAAEALARADRQSGIAALARLAAADDDASIAARLHAAAMLVRYGDERGAPLLGDAVRETLLRALAADASYTGLREDLSRKFAGSRKEHRDWLRAEAATAVRIYRSVDAAATASLLAEQSAAQNSSADRAWLTALAADSTTTELTENTQLKITTESQLFMRFADLRVSLSRPPGLNSALIPTDPAHSLPSELSFDLSDPAAADFLARYATEPADPPDRWQERNRPLAIAQLLRLRDPRAESLLSALLADDSARTAHGLTAISGLRWIDDERHIALLDEIATSLPFWGRLIELISAEHTEAERAYRRTALRRLSGETPWWRLERKGGLALAGLALRLITRAENRTTGTT